VTTQRVALAAVALGGVACLALAYLSAMGRLPPLPAVAVALAPPLAGAIALTWRSRLRWLVALATLGILLVAALRADELSRHVSTLWFVQHAAIHALLAVFFGRTLLPGAEPLTTRIARAVLPSMPPAVLRYSRGVTLAWTVYFVAMAAISVALYVGGSRAAWSTFATLVSGPLVALMFVLEFALRRRMLPASHCGSIAQSVAGFRALVRAPSAHAATARPPHV
jgi:uncharacterized membrane protein